MNEEKLADQLAAGGVSLSKDFVTMIVKHREEFVLVDVPWGVSVSYSMHDILKQVSYLLSRTRTRIPDRARVSISDAGLLSLTAVN